MYVKGRKIPVVTMVLVALNLIGFIYEYSTGERQVLITYAMYEGAIQDGEYLRVITNAFLHIGLGHLVSNMLCLVMYGFILENRIGPLKYALIYLAAVLGASLLINYTGGNAIHAGASGAVWGLMTATLVYNLRNHISPYYALRGIIINLVYSFSANVSWQGHIGGGIVGLLAALTLCQRE